MYLKFFCSNRPQKWSDLVSMDKWRYNTTCHTSIQMSPYEALYGYKPPILAIGPYENRSNVVFGNYLEERRRIEAQLKDGLLKAHNRMK